ncbi:MAG: hypothetical protein ACTSU5_04225 [Promethearchaeota archaeon]
MSKKHKSRVNGFGVVGLFLVSLACVALGSVVTVSGAVPPTEVGKGISASEGTGGGGMWHGRGGPRAAEMDRGFVAIDPQGDVGLYNETSSRWEPVPPECQIPGMDLINVTVDNTTTTGNWTVLATVGGPIGGEIDGFDLELRIWFSYDGPWSPGKVRCDAHSSHSIYSVDGMEYNVYIKEDVHIQRRCAGFFNATTNQINWTFERDYLPSSAEEQTVNATWNYDGGFWNLCDNLTNGQVYYIDEYFSGSGDQSPSDDQNHGSGDEPPQTGDESDDGGNSPSGEGDSGGGGLPLNWALVGGIVGVGALVSVGAIVKLKKSR